MSTEILQSAVSRYLASKRDFQPLRQYFDQLTEHSQAQVLLSSFADPDHCSMNDIAAKLTKTSGERDIVNAANIVFVTESDEIVAYRYDMPTSSASCAVHFVTHMACEVADSFSYSLMGDDGQTLFALMVGNESIFVDGSFKVISVNNRLPHLYSIVVSQGMVKVYIDGSLRLTGSLSFDAPIKAMGWQLQGKPGASLEASLMGLELWAVDAETLLLAQDEQQQMHNQIEQALKDNDLRTLAKLVNVNSAAIFTEFQDAILALMKGHFEQRHSHGLLDWLYAQVCHVLDDSHLADWQAYFEQVCPKPVVEVHDLNVRFDTNPSKRMSLAALLFERGRNKTFDVIEDLSFKVYPGDRVGVIGPNGVGKSTLLKTLAGMLPIRKGKIRIYGDFMMLKAGVGMKTELTGRENIYHAGAYLGFSTKELNEICDEIIEFSELGEAIDRPFKYYSDGMQSRLIFSLATSVCPDILFLDELLSAGDVSFRDKAAQRLEQFMDKIKVSFIVTHGLSYVKEKCTKGLYLSPRGQYYFGDPEEAVARYLADERVPVVESVSTHGIEPLAILDNV